MATHSSILARKIPWTEGAWEATVHGGHKKSDMTDSAQHSTNLLHIGYFHIYPALWFLTGLTAG